MTTKERIGRIYRHMDADRVPIWDSPWQGTVKRWQDEGMPVGIDYRDYFDLDKTAGISVDITPRYEAKTIEETDNYKIYTTAWGATLKSFKTLDSTPDFLGFTITSPDKWLEAKKRMIPDANRVPWQKLADSYPKWVKEGYWITGGFWFGFDVSHSWTVGTERFLEALITEPEWCVDMFNHFLDMNIALFEMVLEKGYRFDSIRWPDDMGYKNNQFFSLKMYRELLKPIQKRAIEWAHSKGIYASLHSCGDINPFVPELVEMGLDALNPLEVKAGMDPVALKRAYGDRLVLHGGVNAVLWEDIDRILAETARILPSMKENGGYIFATDHSIPNNVSLKDFGRIVEFVKKAGAY